MFRNVVVFMENRATTLWFGWFSAFDWRSIHLYVMTLDELVAKVKAQGIVVKDLKTAKADATAAVAELLAFKQALTALDPEHELAIKDKKKKESDKAKGAAGPSAKELRKLEKEKAAQELAAKKAASSSATADVFGDSAIIQSRELTDRAFVNIRGLTAELAGQRKWVRGRVHATRGKGKIAFLVLRQSCFTVQAVAATSGDDAVPKEVRATIRTRTRMHARSLARVRAHA